MADTGRKNLRPLDFLKHDERNSRKDIRSHTGLIVLNTPIAHPDLLNRLWSNACYRICADGGANRLHDLYDEQDTSSRQACIPDEIHGDLDSLRDDVRNYYAKHKVPITTDADQYHTDFEKSIHRVIDSVPPVSDIIVLGSLSGRVDQGLGLLSEIYRQQKQHPKIVFWLFSEDSISFILSKGTTVIETPLSEGLITENAGIIPVFGPTRISLEGFEWDVEDWETEIGGQVSTSNHVKADQVSVTAGHEVLFTLERLDAQR